MNSKVIISETNDKHRSRLIKAFQEIDNLEDYSTKPQGVWGSKATIKCGGVTVKSSELDLEFDIPFDDNLESNEGEIIIYNLSDNTIKQLKRKASLSIEAGYEGDTGVLFKGYITKPQTSRDDIDKVTTLKIIDDIEAKESLNLSYTSGTKASTILKDLLKKTGLAIARFEPFRDWTYENDVKIDEPLESAIKKYSEVCGVSTFTSKGKIYSYQLKADSSNVTFEISEDTGMIGSPSPFEEQMTAEGYSDTIEGFEIEMLLQHRISVGATVRLKSKQYKGLYCVKSGSHRFNESEAITTIKVI